MGATANSTAAVKDGYEFMGWYDAEGKKVSDDMLKDDGKTLSYTTTGNATYYARFKKVESAAIVTQTYIRQLKDGDGWTDITEDSIATLDNYTHVDVVGATASSTASAKDGYEFVGWYDAEGHEVDVDKLSNNGKTLSYSTTGDATYYARFKKVESVATVTQIYIRQIKDGDSWTTITDDGIATLDNYTHVDVAGTTAGSTATAGAGYKFLGWYDAGGKKVAAEMLKNDGKTLNYTTTGNATYYARFSKIAAVEDNETWNDTPETGDKSNPELWTVILLMSMVALAGSFAIRKRL